MKQQSGVRVTRSKAKMLLYVCRRTAEPVAVCLFFIVLACIG